MSWVGHVTQMANESFVGENIEKSDHKKHLIEMAEKD
jgi:hypothetical protein